MPKRALSKIFRAKFRDELEKTAPELFNAIPAQTWKHRWVVHLKAVGTGEKALAYLAPYLFQGPISNKRLIKLENGRVTFLYQPSKTKQWKTKPVLSQVEGTVPAEEFIASFLQHVLPRRFVRVRSYGLLNPVKRLMLHRAQELLGAKNPPAPTPNAQPGTPLAIDSPDEPTAEKPKTINCPKCGHPMLWVNDILPNKTSNLLRARSP